MKSARFEILLAAALGAVILVTVVTGLASLRRDGPAAEPYGMIRADEQRVLDALTRDLRRAVVVPRMDTDDEGIRIVVPDAWRFDPGDVLHRHPLQNEAARRDPPATQTIVYHFFNGTITRTDPWQPRVPDASGKGVDTGPVTLADSMDDFPTVAAEPATGTPVRYRVTFHCAVDAIADADPPRVITLSPEAISKTR